MINNLLSEPLVQFLGVRLKKKTYAPIAWFHSCLSLCSQSRRHTIVKVDEAKSVDCPDTMIDVANTEAFLAEPILMDDGLSSPSCFPSAAGERP